MRGRVKRVVANAQVVHLWAHKVQDDARTTSNNVYFRGDTIYSYGSHFPIARHVTNKAKGSAVLSTTAHYSVTTSGHCSRVRDAISHLKVFNVSNVLAERKDDHTANLADYAKRITESLLKSSRARLSKDWHHKEAVEMHEEAIKYAEFFGLAYKRILPEVPALDSAALADMKKREAKRLAEQRAKTLKDNAEKIERWRAGEDVWLPYGLPDMLRVITRTRREMGDTAEFGELIVQTSRHAEFPVAHAKRALALVRAVRERGEPWQTNGHTMHLGPFKVDTISATGDVKTGCHFVKWEEIERVAPQLDAIAAEPVALT